MKAWARRLRRNNALWALIAVVAIALATLVWIRLSLESQLAVTILENTATEVEDTLYPRPVPGFGPRLAKIADNLSHDHPEVSRLVVTVFLPDEDGHIVERVVYPDALLFGPASLADHRPREYYDLERDGRTVIRLYLDLSLARSHQLNVLLSCMAGAILFVGMLVGWGIVQQEKRIAQDSVEMSAIRGELAGLERRALVGQVSASLIHDLKKPVLHIREEAAQNPPGADALADIREHANLFLAMIRDLNLESFLSSDDAPQEFLYLDDVLQRSYRLVQFEAVDVEFRADLPGDLPMVLAVPHRVVQVFSNLFLNSIEAMNRRGRITTTGCARHGRVEVVVQDSGPGIAPEALPRIFEAFFSGKPQRSSGLGLYICRTLLEEMGGTIEAMPADGGGARFRVTLPAAEGTR